MSDKNKSREKYNAEVPGDAFDELGNLDWIRIPDFPFVMKYKFDEDGYILMVSDLAAVYGEKLNEEATQERFQILNPYAEMLPKVTLKYVKQAVKSILAGEQAHEETELKIILDSKSATIEHKFTVNGVFFIYNFEPRMLSDKQFKAHLLRPILLKAIIIDEEKAALQRKVEELEGKHSSSSTSGRSEGRNIRAIYSAITEMDAPASGFIDAFLCIQKDKIILPESLEDSLYDFPTEGLLSSCTRSYLRSRIKGLRKTTRSIPYKEDNSDLSFESQNTIQQSEEPEISIKIENTEADNLLPKNVKESNEQISPKREMAEDDSKEESASLDPSPAKKKKILKF